MRFVFLTIALLVTCASNAFAQNQPACFSNYQSAVSTITDAGLGMGLEKKLLTKVVNAWRMRQSGQPNGLTNARNQLAVAMHLLNSAATKQIPPKLVQNIQSAIQAFDTCLKGGPPVESGYVTVRAFLFSDMASGGKGPSAGAGVLINLSGITIGTTGSDGTATVQVATGRATLEAVLYPSSAGNVTVTVTAGSSQQVDIILQDGKELALPADLVIDQLTDGVLDAAFTAFVLRFADDQKTVGLAGIDQVELLPVNGSTPISLASMFSLRPDGTLVATNLTDLRSLFVRQKGLIQIHVHGEDSAGSPLDGIGKFYLGRFRISGHLAAPPSYPALRTSGIFVTAKVLNTPLVCHVVSDTLGNFVIPSAPPGNIEFSSETFQNGKYYYGQGVVVLNNNISVTLNMLNATDLSNGVPPFVVNRAVLGE